MQKKLNTKNTKKCTKLTKESVKVNCFLRVLRTTTFVPFVLSFLIF